MTAVYELPPERAGAAVPLFAAATFDRAQIHAVFEGRQNGRLFVDDPSRPAAALLCRTYDYYLAGDPNAGELRRFVAEAPAEATVFGALYGYCPIGADWKEALLADLGVPLDVIERRSFVFEEKQASWPAAWRRGLPRGTEIVPLDQGLAERVDAEMSQFIGLLWGSHARFAEGGFGYCAMVNGAPASVAYAISVGGGEANIDVETVPAWRRRGLVTVTCTAYIDHCLAHGLLPTWDSDAGNLASLATARRLGFRERPRFVEICPRGRGKLPLSHGVWRRTVGQDGVTTWSRVD